MTSPRHEVSVHAYVVDDRADCLRLFEENTPHFFAPQERAEYEAFLDKAACRYLVMRVRNERTIAAGGYYMTGQPGLGALAWGIVARSWQRCGIGRELLRLRLSRLRTSGAQSVRVRTSPLSRGFFERHGFREVSVVPNGFAPGIDLVELKLGFLAESDVVDEQDGQLRLPTAPVLPLALHQPSQRKRDADHTCPP